MLLHSRLRRVRWRLWLIGMAAALAWSLVGAATLLLLAAWLDLVWEMSSPARLAAAAVACAAGLLILGAATAATLRAGTDRRLARRVDRAGGLGGRVMTALDLERRTSGAAASGEPLPPLSDGLARIAVEDAAEAAAAVRAAQAVPGRPLHRAAAVLVSLAVVVGLLAVLMPDLARTQLRRFVDPAADVPPFSPLVLRVEPGNAEVLYGSPLEIRVELLGGTADQIDLLLARESGDPEILPMFPESEGRWRTVLAEVTVPAEYHVRARRARSPLYRIDVLTVPRIEQVRVRIEPPAYTGLGAYEGPVPAEGIAGLPGARVELRAKSNRPLQGGTITLHPADDAPTAATSGATSTAAPRSIAMRPTAPDADEVIGEFSIDGDGKLELRVEDVAGQPSRETFTASISERKDQRPLIRLTDPPGRSLATPTAALPVGISAEDDYGVARVLLFRSLNDSRPLPAEVAVGERRRRRVDDRLDLPLAAYGLQPGDVIKLFGRVEDNDPAGAKGAESMVVVVEIISQEDFERMVQMREGLEALMAKYHEARRRLEGVEEEVERLLSRTRQAPPEEPLDAETRQQAEKFLERLRDESSALGRLARHKMPFDLDGSLATELDSASEMTDRMIEELEKLLGDAEAGREALARQLEKMRDELSGGRERFALQVMIPLEMLEAIFPLVADQARFVMLALRQIDLAERLASLSERDGVDDPALKARMRDLQEEQRAVREALDELLLDIKNHAEQLPDDEKLDRLRETALKFADAVRGSGVLGVMAEAEAALSEFSGTRAAEKAREAADILREFLKQCEGDGSMAATACECLIFQPSLGGGLGDTIAQLLSAMGLSTGFGGGSGMGGGGSGGFSAMRGSSQSMGLFGALGGMGDAYGQRRDGRGQPAAPGAAAREAAANPDDSGAEGDAWAGESGGVGEAAAPLRYRRRVGEYFRRLAEELETP